MNIKSIVKINDKCVEVKYRTKWYSPLRTALLKISPGSSGSLLNSSYGMRVDTLATFKLSDEAIKYVNDWLKLPSSIADFGMGEDVFAERYGS